MIGIVQPNKITESFVARLLVTGAIYRKMECHHLIAKIIMRGF